MVTREKVINGRRYKSYTFKTGFKILILVDIYEKFIGELEGIMVGARLLGYEINESKFWNNNHGYSAEIKFAKGDTIIFVYLGTRGPNRILNKAMLQYTIDGRNWNKWTSGENVIDIMQEIKKIL